MKLNTPALRMTEIVSFDEATKIARRDAVAKTDNIGKYVEANALAYYTLINTWLLQIREVNPYAAVEMVSWIGSSTLTDVISGCSEASDVVIAQLAGRDTDYDFNPILQNLISSDIDERRVLQLLRYPKRFTPVYTEKIASAAIDKLISINNRCKLMQRREIPQYLAVPIRSIIRDILSDYHLDERLYYFSPGVADDSSRPLRHKLSALSKYLPSLDFGYPISDSRESLRDKQYTVQPITVPKNYKAMRVIAPENVYRSVKMQQIRFAMEDAVSSSRYHDLLVFDSQGENQEKCFLGSITGDYITIDLSSASDCVTKTHLRQLFPQHIARDIDQWAPRYLSVNGKVHTMHMLSTAGAPITFPCESILFLAIALDATKISENYLGYSLLRPQIFGDDMIVDARAQDALYYSLTSLGFLVNDEKSFWEGEKYRESCGVEYWEGLDVSSKYYPRKPIVEGDEGIAALISLQHRLYSSQPTRFFLTTLVRTLMPKMTSHLPGTDCADLWESIPRVIKRIAPMVGEPSAPYHYRDGHFAIVSKPGKFATCRKPCCKDQIDHTEMYAYYQFLKNGPRYDSPLDRLLNVTTQQDYSTSGQADPITRFAVIPE